MQAKTDFAKGIYQEYLEEASFLYEQKVNLINSPNFAWDDIADIEERLDAHIDGLVVGGEIALEVCKQKTIDGDFGELHSAVRLFCRFDQLDLILKLINSLAPDDSERIQAISDALIHDIPEKWHNKICQILLDSDQKLTGILVRVIGYQRINAGKELLQLLGKCDPKSLPTVIWALGRLRFRGAITPLLKYLNHRDQNVCSASVLALLRIGEPAVLNIRIAKSQNWAFIPLGLAGNRSLATNLLDILNKDKTVKECITALGLLGDASSIEGLITYLNDVDLAESAAIALNIITGAEIYEDVVIKEESDEEEQEESDEEEQDEEESEMEKNDPLLYMSLKREFNTETPKTKTVNRLSQKPDEWQKWWTDNKKNFVMGIRYRNGKPFSPDCLLENLHSPKSPRWLRQYAYEELVICYGVDIPFDIDMFVYQQKESLDKFAEWIQINGSKFTKGQWYFAGRPNT